MITRSASPLVLAATAAGIFALTQMSGAQTVSYNFADSAQFTDNFTTYQNAANGTNFTWQADGFVRASKTVGANGGYIPTMVLDDVDFTLTPVTIQFDFRLTATGSTTFSDYSVGAYFAVSGSPTPNDALLHQFTARPSNNPAILVRTFSGVNVGTASGGTTLTTTNNVTTGGVGQPPNITSGTWYTMRLGYTIVGGNQIQTTLGWYDQGGATLYYEDQRLLSIAESANYLAGGQVGVRGIIPGSPRTGTLDIDNFSVTAVPEPSAYAAAVAGLLGALVVFRRRRRHA